MSGRGRGDGGRGRGAPRGGRGGAPPPAQAFLYPNTTTAPNPNPAVTAMENAIEKATRPGYSKQGTTVELWTNYIHILPNPQTILYRYDIGVSPEATGRKKTRLVELLLQEGRISAHANCLASDFKSNLISCVQLGAEEMREEIVHRMENEDPAEGEVVEGRKYTVQLQPTGQFLLSDLINYINSTNASEALTNREELIQVFNIVVGHNAKAKPSDQMMSVGSNRHYALVGPSSSRFDLGGGLEAWRGYFTSVRTAAQRLLVNIQVKHAAAYKSGPLPELIDAFVAANGPSLYSLEKFLKRVRVEVTHLPVRKNRAGQNVARIKTIVGLANKGDGRNLDHPPRVAKHGGKANEVEFWKGAGTGQPGEKPAATPGEGKKGGKKSGKGAAPKPPPTASSSAGEGYISVMRHFKQQYNKDLSTKYAVVNVGTRDNPSYLPADVCIVVAGQASNAKLSPNQTANMIKFAVRKPNDNARSIAQYGEQTLGLNPVNATLKKFADILEHRLLTVPGRILIGPDVMYSNNKPAKTAFGSWNMNQIQFCQGKALPKWGILWVWSQRIRDPWDGNARALHERCKEFARALRTNGVQAQDPVGPPIEAELPGDSVGNNRAIEEGFETAASKGIPFLLVLLPSDSADNYKQVKYLGDTRFGIHTVCSIASKFSSDRGKEQYYANVALKFNLKLGGTNQMLQPNKLGVISDGKTMVVGIDVTHPAPGSSPDAKSVAGMVASIGRDIGQFPAILRIQTGRQERVSELQYMLETRLDLWQKHNRALPENIIVYRDGVSEGQYQMVLDEEMPELRKACAKKYPATTTQAGKPAMSIIVVGKRHQTRFYPTKTDPNQIDTRSWNPKNGTVVDRGVTDPRHWDFFLQAHTAIQGTARPAHYFVVHDEIFNKKPFPQGFQNLTNGQEVLEAVTHNMCYMFGRATKAVSICPPAYYADLVCERARCYISGAIDASEDVTNVSGQTGSGGGAAGVTVGALDVHANLRDTMFYI